MHELLDEDLVVSIGRNILIDIGESDHGWTAGDLMGLAMEVMGGLGPDPQAVERTATVQGPPALGEP